MNKNDAKGLIKIGEFGCGNGRGYMVYATPEQAPAARAAWDAIDGDDLSATALACTQVAGGILFEVTAK